MKKFLKKNYLLKKFILHFKDIYIFFLLKTNLSNKLNLLFYKNSILIFSTFIIKKKLNNLFRLSNISNFLKNWFNNYNIYFIKNNKFYILH